MRRVLMEGAEELRRAGVAVETRLGSGDPAEEIGRMAHDIAADLIVVGHREQSALARWWHGCRRRVAARPRALQPAGGGLGHTARTMIGTRSEPAESRGPRGCGEERASDIVVVGPHADAVYPHKRIKAGL